MNNSNENVLPNIRTPKEFYVVLSIIIFLIICLFLIYFKVNIFQKPNSSDQTVIASVFVIFFFCIIIFSLCFLLLPTMKDIKKLFEQISNVSYFIIYTIGIIVYFSFVPEDTTDTYAYIIVPITAILGIVLFYLSVTHNYADTFNINYERIKMILLFVCLIIIFIIYYIKDPGGYISKYFGYTLLIAILIGVFAFLYLIIVITLPDKPNTGVNDSNNLLSNKFNLFSTFLNLGFIVFIFIIFMLVYGYKVWGYDYNGFFENAGMTAVFTIIVLIISILWLILISVNTFPELINNSTSLNYLSVFKRSLLILFGIIVSCLFIIWIVYSIQNYTGESSIPSLLLNIAIVIIILGLIYKTINVKFPSGNNKKNAFLSLILNSIFYIPCIFNNLFDSIGKMISGNFSGDAGSLLMILITIAIVIIYFKMPSVFNIINTQGGQQLLNKPINTDMEYPLGNYEYLNGSTEYDYQYAISFWVFINSAGPNMNENYNKFNSLLNYANKPNILFNGKTNTLMVTTAQTSENSSKIQNKNKNKLTDLDDNGNRILYVQEKFPLQKWHNIIINYSGGILDIFINGELVKSNNNVVPYYTLDNLTIGANDGIEGGICNVIYFKKSLTTRNIYFLYNMVKNKTPPVLNDSNATILVKNVEQIKTSTTS
jgi:hypothetical protein